MLADWERDTLYLKKNIIALSWLKLGNLGDIKPDKGAFKAKLTEFYPEKKPGAIPVYAGQLYRYVYEMKEGDIVVYPSKIDRHIHIGRVEGPYQYNPKIDPECPNIHPVKWLCTVPRTHFTQSALYEIGATMTFFQIKTYTEEFIQAIEGEPPPPPPPGGDVTVPLVAEQIEQTTRDFILKQLAQELKGHPFAEFVAHLLEAMGYRTRVSPEGPDGGIDIIAHKDELGFEPPIIKVQVKSTEGAIGDPIVTGLYGKVSSVEHGLFVTLGTFTPQAKTFAKSKSNLRLIDGDELVDLILQHYEQFDSRYKGLIPLKQVYVPEPLEEAEE